jgi:SWIM zinc finger
MQGRAKLEPLALREAYLESGKATCIVLGSTGKEYIVEMEMWQNKCTCPDFYLRHMTCKHIYFVKYECHIVPTQLETEKSLNYQFDPITRRALPTPRQPTPSKPHYPRHLLPSDPSNSILYPNPSSPVPPRTPTPIKTVKQASNHNHDHNHDHNYEYNTRCPACLEEEGLQTQGVMCSTCNKWTHLTCYQTWINEGHQECMLCRSTPH